MESLPAETAVQVNDKFRYLRNWFGRKSIVDLVDKDASFYSSKNYGTTDTTDDSDSFVSYSGKSSHQVSIQIPDGYHQFIVVPDGDIQDRYFHISYDYLETGILPVPLTTQTNNKNDTIFIDLKTMEALDNHKYNQMPPTRFKCNSDRCLFMLTSFSLDYNKKRKDALRLRIEGYLFKK